MFLNHSHANSTQSQKEIADWIECTNLYMTLGHFYNRHKSVEDIHHFVPTSGNFPLICAHQGEINLSDKQLQVLKGYVSAINVKDFISCKKSILIKLFILNGDVVCPISICMQH